MLSTVYVVMLGEYVVLECEIYGVLPFENVIVNIINCYLQICFLVNKQLKVSIFDNCVFGANQISCQSF